MLVLKLKVKHLLKIINSVVYQKMCGCYYHSFILSSGLTLISEWKHITVKINPIYIFYYFLADGQKKELFKFSQCHTKYYMS